MSFTLWRNTPIQSACQTAPVQNATAILRRDLAMALTDQSESPAPIHIEVAQPENPLDESWQIEAGEGGLSITAASSLGAVFALLHISGTFLGITPFWFWAGKAPAQKQSAAVPDGLLQSQPYAVQFRGWFLNDEVLIEGWHTLTHEEKWKLALEAALRCGANMAIPGTDQNSRKNRQLAADMGLWITHHHAEPLGAEMFARAYPGEQASYLTNPELFHTLWRQGIAEQKDCNVVWAVGFRGQGDCPFWADDPSFDTPQKRGALMGRVIQKQIDILHETQSNPVCCLNLYGEILELYRGGHLKLPDNVICIWADNGYGKMVSRRQDNHNPRVPALPTAQDAGRHGLYYHVSFYDLQTSSHITMLPNPAEMVRSELQAAFAAGANSYLLLNVSNIRPHLYPISLVSALWQDANTGVSPQREAFVARYFTASHGHVAQRLAEYAQHTIQYGKHADERAGEEFYHHPVRYLAAAWMAGRTQEPVQYLQWLYNGDFQSQLAFLSNLCERSLEPWREYATTCTQTASALPQQDRDIFYNMVQLPAAIHRYSCEGAVNFCRSFAAWQQGDAPKAFVLAHRAEQAYAKAVAAFAPAEPGVFKGFYDNDCLSDIRLTVHYMDTLRSWLRLSNEERPYEWRRQYLLSEGERRVMLLTSTTRPLPDGELAEGMANAFGL